MSEQLRQKDNKKRRRHQLSIESNIAIVRHPQAEMEAKRLEVATLVRAGHTTTDIILNVSKATVCRVRKRLEDGESIEDRPRSGRPTKLTPDATKVKVFSSEKKMMQSP